MKLREVMTMARTKLDIAQTIYDRRNALGMTQKQLAEKAGIDSVTVSTLENGYKGPRWDTLMMVTDVLGLEVKVVRKDD